MSTATRKDTTKLTHVQSTCIKAYQDLPDETSIMSFVVSHGRNNFNERIVPMSPDMLRRVATGGNAIHKAMQYGLKALPQFDSIVLLNKREDGKEEAVGIHLYPNSNYAAADMSIELERPVGSEAAIVQLHDYGDIDVLAFPFTFYHLILNFISELEKYTKVKTGDKFTISDVTFTVVRVVGDEVEFRCRSNKFA